jgi:hypothetical protein
MTIARGYDLATPVNDPNGASAPEAVGVHPPPNPATDDPNGACQRPLWICGLPRDGFVRVRAGSLDDTSWLRPTWHIWTRSKQPWITFAAGD